MHKRIVEYRRYRYIPRTKATKCILAPCIRHRPRLTCVSDSVVGRIKEDFLVYYGTSTSESNALLLLLSINNRPLSTDALDCPIVST